MKTRTTAILLAIVVALAFWIKFYESKQPNTEEAQRRAGQVLDLDRDDLEGVEIQNGEETIVLRRTDGKWRLESPIKDQADAGAVERLIGSLERWEKLSTIPAAEIDKDKNQLAEFDLAQPRLRLKLHGKDMPPEILFGKEAALDGRVYVRFAESNDVHLARDTVKEEIAKKPEDFRDRKLTELSLTEVARITLKTPAGEMELAKEGSEWLIVKPLRARADADKVNDLIAQVTSARIEQFVADASGDLRSYGLAEPRGAITLFAADETQGRTLHIGAIPEKSPEQVYVRFSARNFVYTLPKKIEAVLALGPAEMRDRSLIRVDRDMLDRVTIEAPGASAKTVFARKDQAWTIVNLENAPANNAEIVRLLDTLQSARVENFVTDVATDLPKYGLDQPQLRVTLSSFASENTAESQAGEQPLASIAFGRVEEDEVYARVGDEPSIVTVRRSLLDEIPADPGRWQAVAIFDFQPADVQQLKITTDRTVTLSREPDGAWKSAEATVDQQKVDALLQSVARLRAVRWLGAGVPPESFGPTQIALELTTGTEEKRMHKLTVGGPAGDGMWHARVEGRPGVFILSNPDFNTLREPLTTEPTPSPGP